MYNVGDKIVYPMHGAGIIKGVEEKEILDMKKKYYIMEMPIGEMRVMVPVDNVEEVGVREIISLKEMEDVETLLTGDMSKMPKNWNRRYRSNMDKIKSGDIYEIAEVVRNLMLLDVEKGLSTGERKMLSDANQMLVSEMVLVYDKTVEEVNEIISDLIDYDSLEEEE